MNGYFHQDWKTYGTELEVVDQFMSDMPSVRDSLADEIDSLLEQDPSEDDLERWLSVMGCEYMPPAAAAGRYRAWLVRVGTRAREASRPSV